MAKRQVQKAAVRNYRWIKVIPQKGNARMEKRELDGGSETGRVLDIRKC